MKTIAAAGPHTDAAILAIEELVSLRAYEILVGRGEKPEGGGWSGEPGVSAYRPYVVIYPSPGTTDGSLAEPVEYLDFQAQATCVGADQAGAEAVADLVKEAWVNAPLPVVGRSSYRGQLETSVPIQRDDEISPPEHYSIIRVVWRTQAE